MSSHKRIRHSGALILATAIVTWLSGIAPALADPTDLSAVPVVANSSVSPNLIMTFDDSGSMTWRYIGDYRPFDRNSWGNSTCANASDVGQPASTCVPDGPWFCAGVIDPRAPATDLLKTQAMNGVYYNPNVVYSPPKKKDGTNFPNADASLKRVALDGIAVAKPTSPVTLAATATIFANINSVTGSNDTQAADLQQSSDASSGSPLKKRYTCGYGSALASGGPYYWRLKSTVTLATADAYGTPTAAAITAIYTAGNWEQVAVPSTDYQNFANWYSYYRTRNLMARTSMTRAFDKVDGKVRIAWQNLNTNTTLSTIYPLIDSLDATAATAAKTWRTSYFNWLFGVPANGGTPNTNALDRAGTFLSGGASTTHDATNPYWEPIKNLAAGGMELSCRQNFHLLMTDGYWNGNTVSAKAVTPRTDVDPLPADGNSPALPARAYSASSANTKVYWNQKSGSDRPSLADLAFYYWVTDLRTDLTNNASASVQDTTVGITNLTPRAVPTVPLTDDEIYFNPANDPATWQHVVQYMIGLGAPGVNTPTLAAARAATLLTYRTGAGSAQWEAAKNNVANAIDDMWHAAVVSRGKYFNASNPQQLVDALTDILTGIALRRGSNSAIAVSSSVLTTNSKAYVTAYDSADWSGTVQQKAIDLTGVLGATPLWDAGCILTGGPCASTGATSNPAAPARQILTSKTAAGSGVPFVWSSLSSTQQGWLNINSTTGTSDGYGDQRSRYIRGDRTQEQAGATPLFRTRASIFGAVINSSAIDHSRPSDGYSDTLWPAGSPEATATGGYEQFVFDNKDQPETIYAGANDGMLHALEAATGKELWAYVPYAVSQNLNKLTASPYKYQSYVDNTPIIHDVFTHGAWRSLLVGSLRMGGRGVYAIDVTNPTAIKESSASASVQWEFSNYIGTTAANLGYTFGQPNIARLPGTNGKWVVLVPAGYFQDPATDAADPTASLPARLLKVSSLFVLDAENGSLIAEMKTPTGIVSYGLSSPSIGTYTNDQQADFAIAGDLVGNLWRFDMTDLSTVDQLFAPATNGAQPITVMPQLMSAGIGAGAAARSIIIYGTGKYLGVKDRDDAATMPVQAYYGIREYGKGKPAATIADLVQQTITDNSATGIRSITSNPVPAANKGWYFNLDTVSGERNVLNAARLVNTNRVVLESLIPAGFDPCDPSINGTLMLIDAAEGKAPSGQSPFGPGGSTSPTASDPRIGKRIKNPPTTGEAPVVGANGGGQLILPAEPSPITVPDSYWRRRSWQSMQDGL